MRKIVKTKVALLAIIFLNKICYAIIMDENYSYYIEDQAYDCPYSGFDIQMTISTK